MSALAFDTYAAVKKLKEAGFTEQRRSLDGAELAKRNPGASGWPKW